MMILKRVLESLVDLAENMYLLVRVKSLMNTAKVTSSHQVESHAKVKAAEANFYEFISVEALGLGLER